FYKVLLVLLLSIASLINVLAQVDLSYYFPDTQFLNPDITTPEKFIGFQIGEWHLTHTQQLFYLKKLSEESERIQYHTLGKTHEDRPLVHLYISHPDNIRKLELIRKDHLRWSHSNSINTDVNTDRPLIVWQGYSIHGNEQSG